MSGKIKKGRERANMMCVNEKATAVSIWVSFMMWTSEKLKLPQNCSILRGRNLVYPQTPTS